MFEIHQERPCAKPNQTRQQNTLISGMFMNIFFFFFVLHVHQCLNLCAGPPKAHFIIYLVLSVLSLANLIFHNHLTKNLSCCLTVYPHKYSIINKIFILQTKIK